MLRLHSWRWSSYEVAQAGSEAVSGAGGASFIRLAQKGLYKCPGPSFPYHFPILTSGLREGGGGEEGLSPPPKPGLSRQNVKGSW